MPKARLAAVAVSAPSLSVACERHHLAELRDFVRAQLQGQHLSDKLLNQMLVAIDETCANVIVHGNQENPDAFLTLTLTLPLAVRPAPRVLTVEIRDRGIPFDPPAFAAPDLLRYVEERRRGGLGLTLVQLIMDRIEFTTTPDGTNLTRLIKTLP